MALEVNAKMAGFVAGGSMVELRNLGAKRLRCERRGRVGPVSRSDCRVRMMSSAVDTEEVVTTEPKVENNKELEFTPVSSPLAKLARTVRFVFSLRSRVKKGSVLCMKLGGPVADQKPTTSLFSQAPETLSLPEVTKNLRLAAHDPRVAAVYINLEPLVCGYAKVQELRRHMDYFRQSGKKLTIFMQLGGVKEYYLSLSADEVFVPPEAFLSLRGFSTNGSFVRGVLEKIGVEPQVERIGVYKSAGDQLSRKSMSEAQREVLESILNQQYSKFVEEVASVREKSPEEVKALIDSAPQLMEDYLEGGWVTDIKYESEVIDMLKERHNNGRDQEAKLKRPLKSVGSRKYSRVTAKTLGLQGKSCVAIIRASGAITLGKNGSNPASGATVGSDSFVELVRQAIDAPYIKAVVIRIDSPGGVSLAADVMWKEIRKLAEKKPVIASMADVAASGGYYMAMACQKIVAEELTLTGSIGVVTAKISLQQLFHRIGFVRENISIGKYAELEVDNRSFTDAEAAYFAQGAQYAYKSFVSKAAESRGMTYDEMHEFAQGRVWTGLQAKENGLVDEIGGLNRAIQIAKEEAEIKDQGRLIELKNRRSFGGGVLGLLRSTIAPDSAYNSSSYPQGLQPEILLLSEYDGTDTSPVQRHLLGKIMTSATASLDSNVLREIMTRIPKF